MITMTLAQAATVLQSETHFEALDGPHIFSREFRGLSIDTRTLKPGNLFIAFSGKQVDGHTYIEEARLKGAAGALVLRKTTSSLPQLEVADNVAALGKLAALWRNRFPIPVVALTGSNGKTTLKNMLASILHIACGNEDKVLASQGTFNNHLGLPLTLANLNHLHRYAVIEMGMNHFGEIEYLTKLTRPSIAVITNAAAAHIEGVGDVAGVARAKSEIFLGLTEEGTAVLNRDDAFFHYWLNQIGHRPFITFGFHPDAKITTMLPPMPHIPQRNHTQLIKLQTPKGSIDVNLPLLGKHNVVNALAATATAITMDIDLEAIKAGLENTKSTPGRLHLLTLKDGVTIIDDSYNANPVSLQAAIETLASFAGKKILVLGDMAELGQDAKELHQVAGDQIRLAGIDYLFTYGELSAHASQVFGEGAYHFNEQEKLVNALKPFLYHQATILVKGSRPMRMDKVVAGLMN